MNRPAQLCFCVLTIAATWLSPSAVAQNLLTVNAGFETTTDYYTPGWGFPQGSPEALPGWIINLDPTGDGYAGAADNQSPGDLEGTHFGYLYSGTGFAGVLETAPEARAPVEEDATYDLWFLARCDATWGDAVANVSLIWHSNNNNGNTAGTPTNLNLSLPPISSTADPMRVFHLCATAPPGAHYASVRIERPAYDYTPMIFDDFVLMHLPTVLALSVKKQGTNVVLDWPRSHKHKLETAAEPGNPGSWTNVSKPPKGIGAKNFLDFPMTETARFFRLKQED